MFRAGVIGCGNIARVHARALKESGCAVLQAFADRNLEKAEAYARQYGGEETRCYTSLEEMLERENLDAVHICTPHYLHVPMAEKALEKDVHVFLEKPPAISLEEFYRLEQAKDRAKKEVGVCFQNRYNDTTEKLREILESGVLGEVRGARAFVTWDRETGYYRDSSWRGSWETEGGGTLINQAIHTLDLLVYLLGKPQGAEASFHNHHLQQVIEVEDTLEAYIKFPGANACFYATNAYADDAPVLLDLVCRQGRIRMEGETLEIRKADGSKVWYDFEKKEPAVGKTYWGNSHQACIADFYECLMEKKPFRNRLEAVEDTFRLVMELYGSAQYDKIVRKKEEGCQNG